MLPVDAGDCARVLQTGGEFLLTIHVRVAEETPLEITASRVLFPVLRLDAGKEKNGSVSPETVMPLTLQLTVQAESLGVMPNVVTVAGASETRLVAVLGKLDSTVQLESTFTDHAHSAES